MVVIKPTATTETEYEYDENGNVKKVRSVTTLPDDPTPPCVTTVYPGDEDVEGELEYGICVPSLAETFLVSVAGAFLGNVIYQVAKKLGK